MSVHFSYLQVDPVLAQGTGVAIEDSFGRYIIYHISIQTEAEAFGTELLNWDLEMMPKQN